MKRLGAVVVLLLAASCGGSGDKSGTGPGTSVARFQIIQAVKAVEIGDGIEVSARRGSVAHDPIVWDAASAEYRRETDFAGGVEGGITTGALVWARAYLKPLATLARPTLGTIDVDTKAETVSFKERTDATAVPAMGVVAETMMALVLAGEALRKFGGDSVTELVRNRDAFLASLA